MHSLTKETLAKYFDHTLLDETAGEADIRRHCDEAVKYGFYAVCVQPGWVSLCADILHGTTVKVVSVAGFPLGTETPEVKASQAQAVIMNGADEVDIVANPTAVQAGDADTLRRDFGAVLRVCRAMKPPVALKVIIESAALDDEQVRFVCGVAEQTGVDFLKTSTGYHQTGGAHVDDVKLMAESAPRCKIKAAGGIKTLEQTLAFIEAGAVRIGASASVQIMEEFIAANGNQ
ncbi:MAG: deoxyribose-phosphate aldolase [Phycisphaerae bacterium]|nr:deoxyribose-phosphate aldolase [Phycisphaerae bacterium]